MMILFPDPAFDTSTTTSEAINGATSLPRGACTGTLIPSEGLNPSPSPPTTEPPIEDNFCQYNDEKMEFSNGALLTCKWVGSKRARLRKRRCKQRTVDGQLV